MRTLTFFFNGGECCNPTLRKCEDETDTPEMGTWESSGTLKTKGAPKSELTNLLVGWM